MNIGSVLNTGIQGVQAGVRGMEQSAQEIVKAGSGESATGDFIEPIIDLKLYEHSVEASTKVIKTADEMIGTLLDTMA